MSFLLGSLKLKVADENIQELAKNDKKDVVSQTAEKSQKKKKKKKKEPVKVTTGVRRSTRSTSKASEVQAEERDGEIDKVKAKDSSNTKAKAKLQKGTGSEKGTKKVGDQVAPLHSPKKLTYVEKQKRADFVIRSAKKASRKRNMILSGTNKRPESVDKPLADMTIREIIKKSLAEERCENRKKTKLDSDSTAEKADVNLLDAPSENGKDALPSTSDKQAPIAPQVQVVDGEIVINKESLSVQAQVRPLMKPERRVEESGNKLSASSYSGYLTPEKWTDKDTATFYQALRQFGLDFGLIQKLFPSRARRQIKSKFMREEKKHPEKINEALNSYGSADCVDNFKNMVELLQKAEEAAS